MTVAERLAKLGIELPQPLTPVANYVPFTQHGSIVHVSGQLSMYGDDEVRGTVGSDVDLDRARAGARMCGINLLAQFRAACGGNLDRVARVLKLGGFVRTGPDFDQISQVINGCSDLMVEVFGDAGYHARSAVGVRRLPMGYAVEVDAVIALTD